MYRQFNLCYPTWILLVLLLSGCLRPASQEFAALPSPQASQEILPSPTPPPTPAQPTGLEPTSTLLPASTVVSTPTSPPAARSTQLVFRLPRHAFPPGLALNGNYQVFLANLDGSSLVPLTPRLGGDLLPVDVSTAGEVLVTRGTELFAASLAPGEPRLLAEDYAGLESSAYWLPGGEVVYIGREGGERAVFRVNADGSGRQRLTRPGEQPAALLPVQDLGGVTWHSCLAQDEPRTQPATGDTGIPTPAETGTPGDPSCYHRTSLDGSQTRPVWPGAQVAVRAPAGEAVAYHAANGGGWQAVPVFAADAQGRLIGETEPLNVCSLAWSPDGRQLLIGQLFGENFCGWYLLWQPGESELEELPQELPASYAQRWSPDGAAILFEDWSGAWIYDLATGALNPALSTLGASAAGGTLASHILWVP